MLPVESRLGANICHILDRRLYQRWNAPRPRYSVLGTLEVTRNAREGFEGVYIEREVTSRVLLDVFEIGLGACYKVSLRFVLRAKARLPSE